jgi:hypothetical protein
MKNHEKEKKKTTNKEAREIMAFEMFCFCVEGGWSERWGFTYTGKEVLLIRVSPVVDTALKFRGQCDFGLVVGCGQRHTRKAASGGWWKKSGGSELGN